MALRSLRTLVLPDELVVLLRDHRREQLKVRIHAGSLWQEGGRVFTTLVARPIAPNSDYHEWRHFFDVPGCGTRVCTTAATPPQQCCSSSVSPSGRSCRSWAGRAHSWPRDIST